VEPTAGFRAQGPTTWAHPAYANKNVFARNDRELLCASLAASHVTETKTATLAEQSNVQVLGDFEKNAALGLAYSPDGRLLAAGTWSGQVKIIELSTGAELPGPKPHNDWVCAVAMSPDGKFLLSAGGSEFKPERNRGKTTGQIKLWDLAAAKEVGEFVGHANKVFSAAFSPDSKALATASADETVRLWDVATRNQRAVLHGHKDAVWSVAFSPDGTTVASAGVDRSVKLWDAAAGEERATLRGHEDEVHCVAFSPDGKTIATGSADWTVRIWDSAARKERAVLTGHQGGVHCLAFSPDGNTLATGSGDDTIKLWSMPSGKERATLRAHRSGISAVTFSPDGRCVASAGMDDAVRLWILNRNR
jgi:WD40 repeat protein